MKIAGVVNKKKLNCNFEDKISTAHNFAAITS